MEPTSPPAESTPPPAAIPVRSQAETNEAVRLVGEYLREVAEVADRHGQNPPGYGAKNYHSGRTILESPLAVQAAVASAVVRRMYRGPGDWETEGSRLTVLLNTLLTRRLPFNQADHRLFSHTPFPLTYPEAALRMVEEYAEAYPLQEESLSLLRRLHFGQSAEQRRLQARARALLNKIGFRRLKRGEPWADAVIEYATTLPEERRVAWEALLGHAYSASGSKPSGRWLKTAEAHLARVGHPKFWEQVVRWFELSAARRFHQLHLENAELLKGLVWCCSLLDTPETARVLGATADTCYQPGQESSLRAASVGNACAVVLGGMSGPEPIAELCRLQLQLKHRPSLQVIEKALAEAAARAGMTPADLAELTVPTFGMQSPGFREEPLGDYTAVIEISDGGRVEWRWRNAEGKLQKAVPAAVKDGHYYELKDLKQSLAELQKLLPMQRERLERQLLTERNWALAEWRARYLEHPLLTLLTRRLIWHFQYGDRKLLALPSEGRLTDVEGRAVEGLPDETRVRLWHPLGFAPEEVLRWRVRLEEQGITQPFKQAHREIYLLTDAELNARTYSHRFAAHVLKQHQFSALCIARGWSCRIDGLWGTEPDSVARLRLPGWGLRAEYRFDPVPLAALPADGDERYLVTDELRFCRDGETEPLPLTEVPALAFTEVMRDVDLFVGVAGVGNDPTWGDARNQFGYRDYWTGYSFGDLAASAVTRRDVLERLLPRLKIKDRCRLDGKFLRVRGELRSYKIHLGSGNILMEPNDQYLCIVPERSGGKGDAESLYLPFEGDRTLALILSKAFLLAADHQIKDPAITRQLGERR